ncbi:S8 family serine peptidase [Streptomyces thermocarboxydus]|uniref:S8 family serine peptidase n=1 Tax=Streptomyces thermocarboxydus TaxID=59299 RepID=UPI0025CA1BE4|nr:S8 family serine peptidase [Streptomyces thermocarboxydus]
MKRRGPGAVRPLCGAALAAALLLPVAAPAAAGQASAVPAADGKRQELPPMPSALDPGAGECTAASREKAEKQDWSRQRLDLTQVHRHGTGAGTTVALVDTGVRADAAGLGGRVTARGAAGDDCVGHGTFLAGLIVGEGWGRTRLPGVAPGATLLALRGTDQNGSADAALVAQAVRDATAAGADVIVVGVALPKRDEELTSAVAEAVDAGAVVVAAATPDPPNAGSRGETPTRTYWPAGEPGVLSVADMLPTGARPDNALPTDGVDLVAPGAGVVSGGPRGDGHYLGAGASVAAAYTAGTAALVRAARPDDTPEEIVHRLTATAYPADIPQLDAYAALTTVLGDAPVRAQAAAGPVTVRDTASADRAANRAVVFVLLGTAGVLAVLWAVVAVPRARARGWRPADTGRD